MILKAMYLDGRPVNKSEYRALAQRGERGLGVLGTSGMSEVAGAVLKSFPIQSWRHERAANVAVLATRLAALGWAQTLAAAGAGGVPFSGVVVLDSPERRELVRVRLIEANVFPAVLWQLEQTVLPVGHESRELSRRMLSIHCDGRYDAADMLRVGELIVRSDVP